LSILQAIFLGVIQGAAEFIPVSSSGHLVLVPWLLGWEAPPNLTFIIVLHLGTTAAVLVYFWPDWGALLRSGLDWLRNRDAPNPGSQLLLLLVIGTVPAAIVGCALSHTIDALTSHPLPASIFLLVTSLILFANSLQRRLGRSLEGLTPRDALFIGMAQALAVFAGISRSGITITAGRMRGLDREDAARFSFLLAMPVILGAGILSRAGLVQEGHWANQLPALVAGFASAAVIGYMSIRWLMGYLKKSSTLVFAVYCALAGSVGLVVFMLRGG
jgi:undecaprenyl-diphosphatase